MFSRFFNSTPINDLADEIDLLHRFEGEGLKVENERLRALVAKLEKSKPLDIPFEVGDPLPVDREQRALYVAQVAGLYTEVLKPKLLHMIANTRMVLSDVKNSHEEDLMLKGAIFSFQEFIRWGDMMVNEQMANQNGENNYTDK